MRHPMSNRAGRAERRAAPKPARAPSGGRRRTSIPRLLGECPPERHPACKPDGRPTYASGGGLS
jgi:hypothetical protein